MADKKEKIVVLGGGIGSLSTVFELTESPDWQEKYDITVYQMGWRLGGKGASGRNPQLNQRIEEHGFHIWFGFYENSFNAMYRCYNALQRSPDARITTVQNAFRGVDIYSFQEKVDGKWIPWEIEFPHDDSDFPGIPDDPNNPYSVTEFPSMWEYLKLVLNFIHEQLHHKEFREAVKKPKVSDDHPTFLKAILYYVHLVRNHILMWLFVLVLRFISNLNNDEHKSNKTSHSLLKHFLHWLKKWINSEMDKISEKSNTVRRIWILVDIALSCSIGGIEDGVLQHGLDVLNQWEFTKWLERHDASDTAIKSAPIQAIYDAAFAYSKGNSDFTSRNMAAGVYIRAMLRIALTYKGHVVFKMNGGMGDIIFGPIYQLLQQRGVKFKFFHRVTNLQLNTDKTTIAKIQLARQVDLNVAEYDPLLLIGGLPSWPDTPIYEQIKQGDALRRDNIDLESRWAKWKDVAEVELDAEAGDFDRVILGISLAALPEICGELIDNKKTPQWANMFAKMETVQTQAVQLWMKPTSEASGYPAPSGIIGAYVEPFASWIDFTQIIDKENYPPEAGPGSIIYSCGVLQDEYEHIPPPDDHDFPAQQKKRVKDIILNLLKNDAGQVFSKDSTNNELDWNALLAPENLEGEERFDAQYWRANVDPTERYVLSVVGSDEVRIKADETGYSNLIIAGTWTNNGFNLGSIEAGVMSGMKASRAICGYPKYIVGEGDIFGD